MNNLFRYIGPFKGRRWINLFDGNVSIGFGLRKGFCFAIWGMGELWIQWSRPFVFTVPFEDPEESTR